MTDRNELKRLAEALEIKPEDAEIIRKWKEARSVYGANRLGQLIALKIADEMEAQGVTEADIERLFPKSALSRIDELERLADGEVKIKPLEWHKSHMTGWNGDWHTNSPFILTVRCADENGWKWTFHGGGAHGYEASDEAAKAAAQAEIEQRIRSALVPSELTSERDALRARVEWQPIETAPKDCDIFVWFDHEADPYQDPQNPSRLTDYAAWADGGDFLAGKGVCIARWHTAHWESEDEYGNGYWLPAWWFARENDDYERVVNPTHWMPLPLSPQQGYQP